MTFVSYAQNFEDVILWRVLHDVEGGRYLDIGAQDPVIDSVSLAFYKAGWRGIHVEPTPAYAARLREARPEEIVIEAAVTDASGPIPFFEIPDTGISTGKKDIAAHHTNSGYKPRKTFAPTVRLDALFDMIDGDVHWMKIDVEGMEPDVLRSWGESAKRPWLLVIEATYPSTQEPTHHLWSEEVLRRGYTNAYFDGLSCYFVHEDHRELVALFDAPANVFDRFAISSHHFSASVIRDDLESTDRRLREEQAHATQLQHDIGDARRALEIASKEKAAVVDLLHATEELHRTALEALAQERRDDDQARRREFRAREEQFHSDARAADAATAAALIELARVEERNSHLQDRLDRAEQSLDRSESRLSEILATSDRVRSDLEQRLSDSNSKGASVEQDRDQLRAQAKTDNAEIDRLRSLVARADDLILAAASARPGRWQRIGQSLRLARPSEQAQRLATWSPSSVQAQQPAISTDQEITLQEIHSDMHPSAPSQARNPYLRADSLPELLSWNDVDFVRCAYVTVLGRQPDWPGEGLYTDRIRHGHSKYEILWQLRRSTEGAGHDPGIAGLDRALKRAAWARKPVIGALIRAIYGLEGDRPFERHRRAVMNELGRLRSDLARGLKEQGTNELRQEIRQLADRLHAAPVPPSPQQQPLACSRERPIGEAIRGLNTRSKSIYLQLDPATER